MSENPTKWQDGFSQQCLQVPGQHVLIVGRPGSGKTQAMYWVAEGILHEAPRETVVWFDTGKSSEILTLAAMHPVTVHMPKYDGLKVDLLGLRPDLDVEVKTILDFPSVWQQLVPDRVNVICFEPFILDPEMYTLVVRELFYSLIHLAHNEQMISPVSIFYDEFHRIAPSRSQGFSSQQERMGAILQQNIERLRSLGIRFAPSTQGWWKLRKGVRDAFDWIIAKRGATFDHTSEKKLSKFGIFESLRTDQCIIIPPSRSFSDIMDLPFYGDGKHLGKVRYQGVYGMDDVWMLKKKREKIIGGSMEVVDVRGLDLPCRELLDEAEGIIDLGAPVDLDIEDLFED